MTTPSYPFDEAARRGTGRWPAGRLAIDLLALLRPPSGAMNARVRVVPMAELDGVLASEPFNGLPPSDPLPSTALREGYLVACIPGEFFATDRAAPLRVVLSGDVWSIDFDIVHAEDPNMTPAPGELWLLLGLHPDTPAPHSLRLGFPSRWSTPDGQAPAHATPGPAAESFQVEFR